MRTTPLPAAKRVRSDDSVPRSFMGDDRDAVKVGPDCHQMIKLVSPNPGTGSEMLQRMHDLTELCDITLRVRDESGEWTSLRAHRLVLAAASDALRAMLVGSFRERSEDEITLQGVVSWSARALLDFIYTGRTVVRSDRLLEMARVADFVGLAQLRGMCVEHTISGLGPGNAAEIVVAADEMGLSDLKEQSIETILHDYVKVMQTPAFEHMSCGLMEDILQRDGLRVRKEEEVFESVVRWLNADESRGAAEVERLLPLIRFPFMSPHYLIGNVEQTSMMKSSECLPRLLAEAKNYMILSLSSSQNCMASQRLEPTSCRTRPRTEFGDVFVEGQQPGEPQVGCMGVYELQDWSINARPVYQQQGDTDVFLYYATTEKWYISDGEDMRSGRPRGWCQVTSKARTPDKIVEEWTVWDTPVRSWEASSAMKCRLVNDAIRMEVNAKQQVQMTEARRWAQQVGDIVIEGQQEGDLQHDCMGIYELQNQVVNGRPVYRQQGGGDMYLFYASRGSKWCISDGEDMWAGRPKGWCYVVSQALTPDQIVEQWEVVADYGGMEAYWQAAPRFRARPLSKTRTTTGDTQRP